MINKKLRVLLSEDVPGDSSLDLKEPHPNCKLSKDELKDMSFMLSSKGLRRRFFFLTYLCGEDPDKLMDTFLSLPDIHHHPLDADIGYMPKIPKKLNKNKNQQSSDSIPSRHTNSESERGSNRGSEGGKGMNPPWRNCPGPSRRDPSGPPPPRDEQSFKQQCQRLVSNIGNFGTTGLGMFPLVVPDTEEVFHDQPSPNTFDEKQPRQEDRRNFSQRGPSAADLPGVDGALKQEYERLLSNVNKIGGLGNVDMDIPLQNNPGSSGMPPSSQPGPSRQKRKNFHEPCTEPKRSRFQEEPDHHRPAGTQRGPRGNLEDHGSSRTKSSIPPKRHPLSETTQNNRPDREQPRQGGNHGNMPPFNNGPPGNMPPFNTDPPGHMPSFNNGPPGYLPQFNYGPAGNMPPFYEGPPGNMPPFYEGPPGNMPPFNNGPPGNMPPFNNGPPCNMRPFNYGPPENMPPFNNGPACNMPSFNNSGPPDHMQPFMPPFSNPFHGVVEQPISHTPSDISRGNSSGPHPSIEQLQHRHHESANFGRKSGGLPPVVAPGPPNRDAFGNPKPPNTSATRGGTSRMDDHGSGDPTAPLFIVPMKYPSERFSDKQMDAIESAILDAILEIDDQMKPTFQDSFRNKGRYGVICNDQFSKNWLFSYLSECRPWPYASFKVISAEPTKIKAFAKFPLCENDDNDKILKFIAKQNTKLNVGLWEVVKRLDSTLNTSLILAIDQESGKLLKDDRTINFKMGRAEIVVAEGTKGNDQSKGPGAGGDGTQRKPEAAGRTSREDRGFDGQPPPWSSLVRQDPMANSRKKNEPKFGVPSRSGPEPRSAGACPEPRMSSNKNPREMHEPRFGVTEKGPGLERSGNFEPPRFDRRSQAPFSRPPKDLPPPSPPALGDALRSSRRSPEYRGASEYEPSGSNRFFRTPSPEPSRNDRFFRTPSPEPSRNHRFFRTPSPEPSRNDRFFRTPSPEPRVRPTSDFGERSRQGARIPPSGGYFERDHSTLDRSIPVVDSNVGGNARRGGPSQQNPTMDRPYIGAMQSNQIPAIDRNDRRDWSRDNMNSNNRQLSAQPAPGRSNRSNFPQRR